MLVKDLVLKKYIAEKNAKQKALQLAEQKRKKQERFAKKKQELEDRLLAFRLDVEKGLVNLQDFQSTVDSINSFVSDSFNTTDQDIVALKQSIIEIQSLLKNHAESIKGVRSEIPNLNDFRLEINKRINNAIELLDKKIKNIKISDFSDDIKKINEKIKTKLDKSKLPRPVVVKGSENIKVVKDVTPSEIVYRVYGEKPSNVVLGKGPSTDTLDVRYLRNTFETVAKNLKAYPYAIVYSGDNISTITYNLGSGSSIVKTLNYSGDNISTIVLSGNTPGGIDLTKTLTYTGDNITSVSYS